MASPRWPRPRRSRAPWPTSHRSPANRDLARLADPKRPIRTLVVNAADSDLLVFTNQHVLVTRIHDVGRGIRALKQMTGIEEVYILVRSEVVQGHGHIEAHFKTVDHRYPSSLPPLVMARLFKRTVPAGGTPEDLGFCFVERRGRGIDRRGLRHGPGPDRPRP